MNFIIILILEKRNSSREPNLFEKPQPSLVLFATHETLNSSVIEYVNMWNKIALCVAS